MKTSYLCIGILWICSVFSDEPLHIHINEIKSPVTIGESVYYTVEISNTTLNSIDNVQLVISPSFGLDIVNLSQIATSEISEDVQFDDFDYIEEEGVFFEPCTLEASKTIYYEIECEVFSPYFDEEEQNGPLHATVYYSNVSEELQKITKAASHFQIEDAAYLEVDIIKEDQHTTKEQSKYEIAISNIGTVGVKNVGAVIRYNCDVISAIEVESSTKVSYSEGIVFVHPISGIDADPDGEEAGWEWTVLVRSLQKEQPFEITVITEDFTYPKALDENVVSTKNDKMFEEKSDFKEKITTLPTEEIETVVVQNPVENNTYILYLKNASYTKRKPNNKKWDFGFGKTTKPDSLVVVHLWQNGGWTKMYTTKVQKNDLQPKWDVNTTIKVKVGSQIKFEVFDKDLSKNDKMGSTIKTINIEHLTQGIDLSFDSVISLECILQIKTESK
ncbi:hypothetical protein [Candidatus Uabimicrobium sp. HlEnr_7]|uniref:hypothetical protein n=1 Tax=Candidatus Uabimicrobium helgolandensis TaxID=3095367 RepID=UPI00355768E1